MTITLVDPSGSGGRTDRKTAPRLETLEGLRIGLLSNGKANADVLLKETARHFERRHGCEVTHFIDKRNAGRPAQEAHHRELAERADFLITAVGD